MVYRTLTSAPKGGLELMGEFSLISDSLLDWDLGPSGDWMLMGEVVSERWAAGTGMSRRVPRYKWEAGRDWLRR